MGNYTIFGAFENLRRGGQARNLTANFPKILYLKSSSEQIFSKNCRWVPLCCDRIGYCSCAPSLGQRTIQIFQICALFFKSTLHCLSNRFHVSHLVKKAICMMASFYCYDQDPSGFCFLVQMRVFVI